MLTCKDRSTGHFTFHACWFGLFCRTGSSVPMQGVCCRREFLACTACEEEHVVAAVTQITGFSDISTATINTCFNAGNAIGMVLGGLLGDLLSKRFSRAARPLINQISMLVVAPLNLILYKVLPGKTPSWAPNAGNTGVQAVSLQSRFLFCLEEQGGLADCRFLPAQAPRGTPRACPAA